MLTATSRSASSNTTSGDLPPNSKVTLLRLLSADPLRMMRPTSVEPVKATLSTSGWWTIDPPAVGPYPGRMLMTPGGKPA